MKIKIKDVSTHWTFCRPRLIRINPISFDEINERFHLLPSVAFNYRYQPLIPYAMQERFLESVKVTFDWLRFHSHIYMYRSAYYEMEREND